MSIVNVENYQGSTRLLAATTLRNILGTKVRHFNLSTLFYLQLWTNVELQICARWFITVSPIALCANWTFWASCINMVIPKSIQVFKWNCCYQNTSYEYWRTLNVIVIFFEWSWKCRGKKHPFTEMLIFELVKWEKKRCLWRRAK